ncbi:hypothetical protein ACFX2C_024344 [Malus domestica]
MLVCGPSRECTLICTLRREYTLSRGPNRECTLPERSVRSWLSGCFPGRCWRGSWSALVLLQDTLVWGTLHLGALQELVPQGRLLCEKARQLYDLLRQVLFSIWVGIA